MKLFPYHDHEAHAEFMLKLIETRPPEKVAFDFHSVYDLHNGLQASHSHIRQSAAQLADVINVCRKNDVEVVFYGLRNEQKLRIRQRVEKRKNKIHSFNEILIKKAFSHDRGLEDPEWALKSVRNSLGHHLLSVNNRLFLRNPYGLPATVLANKLQEMDDEGVLAFVPFEYYSSIKKTLKKAGKYSNSRF